MKRVELKNGRVVETPWLRIEESAAYCGMARSTFLEKAKNLPYGGDEHLRLYHSKVLDMFLAGEYPGVPFAARVEAPVPRRRRRTRKHSDDPCLIVDPVTGEVHRPPSKTGEVAE